MAGAYEPVSIDEAVGKRTPVVGAGVGDDVGPSIVEDHDRDGLVASPCRHHLAPTTARERLVDGEAPRRVGLATQEIAGESVGARLGHRASLSPDSDIAVGGLDSTPAWAGARL